MRTYVTEKNILYLLKVSKEIDCYTKGHPLSFDNGMTALFRLARVTPKKVGQFVTLWKRNELGVTKPYDVSDNVDFFIIFTGNTYKQGCFIFTQSILLEKNIISQHGQDGKRGLRVYPPWDLPVSKQAKNSQEWQCNYFYSFEGSEVDR